MQGKITATDSEDIKLQPAPNKIANMYCKTLRLHPPSLNECTERIHGEKEHRNSRKVFLQVLRYIWGTRKSSNFTRTSHNANHSTTKNVRISGEVGLRLKQKYASLTSKQSIF